MAVLHFLNAKLAMERIQMVSLWVFQPTPKQKNYALKLMLYLMLHGNLKDWFEDKHTHGWQT